MHIESSCSHHIVNIYFPFHVRWRYQGEVDDSAWVMEGLGWKKKLLLLHHFIKELDWFCFLSPRFPFQKDAQKPLLFGTRNREDFSPGGTTSPQLPSVKSLYGALSNQPIAIFLVFNTFAWQVWLGWNVYWIGLRKILCLIC